MRRFVLAVAIVASAMSYTVHATVYPDGGTQMVPLQPGMSVDIGWRNDLQADRVNISLWNADTRSFVSIAQNVTAASDYTWMIPPTLQSSDRYRFMIADADDPRRYEMSRGWVSIGVPQPVVSSVDDLGTTDNAIEVSVMPFPSSTSAVIEWQDQGVEELQVLDLHHQLVRSVRVDPSVTSHALNVSSIAAGLYFVKVIDGSQGTAIIPLLVQH